MSSTVVRSCAIAVEDFVGLGKPVAIQDQAHDDLLAVRPVIARVPAFGLGIVRALAFEVRRRQVVEVDRVVQVEERALARGQGLLDGRPLRMQPIEVAIERLVAERAEVRGQNIGQGRAPDPVRHGVLRRGAHQPVQRHHFGEHAGARAQTRPWPGSRPASAPATSDARRGPAPPRGRLRSGPGRREWRARHSRRARPRRGAVAGAPARRARRRPHRARASSARRARR